MHLPSACALKTVCLCVLGNFVLLLIYDFWARYVVIHAPLRFLHGHLRYEHTRINVTENQTTNDAPTAPPENVLPILKGIIPGDNLFQGSFGQAEVGYLHVPTKACQGMGLLNKIIRTKLTSSSELRPVTIFVLSLPEEFAERETVRNTWASVKTQQPQMNTVFVLGLTKNAMQQSWVDKEAEQFEDILQARMVEKYRNLAWKTFFLLHWAKDNCRENYFFVKTDTDTIIFKEGLDNHRSKMPKSTNTIWGARWAGSPIRDKNSKWYASTEDYNETKYPAFTSGTGYMMTGNVPAKLVAAAKKRKKYFHLEDVMFTGLAAEAAGVNRVSHPGFVVSGEVDHCNPMFITRHMWSAKHKGVEAYWRQHTARKATCNAKRKPKR